MGLYRIIGDEKLFIITLAYGHKTLPNTTKMPLNCSVSVELDLCNALLQILTGIVVHCLMNIIW